MKGQGQGQGAGATSASGCLDDEAVLAYAERRLSRAEHALASAHLDTCDDCLAVVCAVARSAPELGATKGSGPAPGAARGPGAAEGGEPAGFEGEAGGAVPGQVVGRYVLIEMVGQGAMGSVFAAHDAQLDRKVALKLVRSERLALAGARARFSREARAMAKVAHPNVVRVYDAGEVGGGVFIAMEFVEGATLSRWLEGAERSWQEVVVVFLEAGRGLAAAHAAGIVHRDFKPDNALVDRAGRVAVTDFGLATAQGAVLAAGDLSSVPLEEAATLTKTGALLGTPRYMSPEQYAGGRVDARTDQFSFAVALYEALYRERPFRGETVGELRDAVVRGLARPAPEAAGRVPPRLHRALLRALRAEPEARYPTLEGLLDELEAARGEVRGGPTPGPGRRAPRLATIAAASALVVVAAVASTLSYRASGRTPAPPASASGSPVPAPVVRAGGRRGVLIFDIVPPPSEPRLEGTLEVVLAAALNPSKRLDAYWGASLAALADQIEGASGPMDEGAARALASRDGRPFALARAAIAPRVGGFELSLRVNDAGSGGTLFDAREASADAPGLVAAALRLGRGLRAALGDPAPGGAAEGAGLSASLDALHAWKQGARIASTGDYVGSLEPLRRAVAIDPNFAEAHATLGRVLSNLLRYDDASSEFGLALRDAAALGERRRLTILGDSYGAAGRHAEAIASYEQLLSSWPADADVENGVAAEAMDAEAWPLALNLARRAAENQPKQAVARSNLVIALLANNAFGDAVREGEIVLAEFSRVPSYGLVTAAVAQALAGKPGEARATLDRLAALDPDSGDAGRADLAFYEGRLDDAVALLKRYIDRTAARGTPEDGRVPTINLGRLLLRRGDKAGARAAAIESIGGGNARTQYFVATLLVEAGAVARALEYAGGWPEGPASEWRAYARLVRGDVLRARGQAREAAAAYLEAKRAADTWIVHERLGKAYLAAGAWGDAEREIAWCLAHGGEGAVFSNPGLSYLSALRYDLARAKEGARSLDAAAAYREFLAAEPAAQSDPLADDARRRLAALERTAAAPERR